MIKFKLFLLSSIWSIGWSIYFVSISAPVTLLNVSFAFAPFIVWFIWFILFVWDD